MLLQGSNMRGDGCCQRVQIITALKTRYHPPGAMGLCNVAQPRGQPSKVLGLPAKAAQWVILMGVKPGGYQN